MPEQFPCHNLTLDLNTKNEATDDFSKHVELLVRVCINSVWSKMCNLWNSSVFFAEVYPIFTHTLTERIPKSGLGCDL